jgi:hypothetical protein
MFGNPRHVESHVIWSFDDCWECDPMDHEVDVECGIAGLSGYVTTGEGGLDYSWEFWSNREQLEPGEYGRVQDFRRKVEGFRESKIVLTNLR